MRSPIYRNRLRMGKKNAYSRPRSRAKAVVIRCTVFGPPVLFDRGRACGRNGKNWTVSTGDAAEMDVFSIESIGDFNVITTDGLWDKVGRVCSAISRMGDGGGKHGSGFEDGYAGGGCDGDGGGIDEYDSGGANMIVVLESEKAELAVRLVQDSEGRLRERETLGDWDESAASAGAES